MVKKVMIHLKNIYYEKCKFLEKGIFGVTVREVRKIRLYKKFQRFPKSL